MLAGKSHNYADYLLLIALSPQCALVVRRMEDRASPSRVHPLLHMQALERVFDAAPKSLADTVTYTKVVRIADKPRGGHFPALEQPALWVDDVFSFFASLAG